MQNIGIPEIIVIKRLEDTAGRSIKYEAESASRPAKCINPDCDTSTFAVKHDSRSYLLHDVKSEGKLVYINLKLRRYKCPCCGCVFPEHFSFFQKREHLTIRLKNEIIERCIKGETFRYIANDYGIDPKTVAHPFITTAIRERPDRLCLKDIR